MRVFLTGATGFIGSAIAQELIRAGHHVLGLARNDAAAAALTKLGIEVHRGDLTDPESLAAGARACEGVIHTAFNHDFSKWAENCEADRRAIEALGSALAGSARPLVVTSGTAIVAAPGRVVTEEGAVTSHHPRVASENATTLLAARGIHVSVLRLPPTVHGEGDHGFVPAIIGIARQKGVSAYVGDGLNRWPAVHRFDAARLFRLVLENGIAGGKYHGVAEEGIPVRDIAGVIARHLNVPAVSITSEEAGNHFGFLGPFLSFDLPASSALTQQRLGWHPTQIGLIPDLDGEHYFKS
ncbi:MAG TPA: SDR family oxidoreductase [Candidatus Saccharimonadales bacterium]|jgi:nucleoside-diphosphate-sugar epimerase|nr:SDR family oxidoreductase [Candidatus Saccharimonadales bacterium]